MASLLNLFTSANYSLYTIPLAWAITFMPHMYAISTYEGASSKGKYDSRAPREFVAMVQADQSIDSKIKGRIFRAEAAQTNGFENIGLFAAAVVAGNMAKLDVGLLNGLTVGYVVSRFIYNPLYIFNTTKLLAAGRGATYVVGLGCCMAIYILAGNALRSSWL